MAALHVIMIVTKNKTSNDDSNDVGIIQISNQQW